MSQVCYLPIRFSVRKRHVLRSGWRIHTLRKRHSRGASLAFYDWDKLRRALFHVLRRPLQKLWQVKLSSNCVDWTQKSWKRDRFCQDGVFYAKCAQCSVENCLIDIPLVLLFYLVVGCRSPICACCLSQHVWSIGFQRPTLGPMLRHPCPK